MGTGHFSSSPAGNLPFPESGSGGRFLKIHTPIPVFSIEVSAGKEQDRERTDAGILHLCRQALRQAALLNKNKGLHNPGFFPQEEDV